MFRKIFNRKAADLSASLKKIENKDKMEAIIYACVLTASSDEKIDDGETRKLDELIRANESMSHFGHEITETINRAVAKFKANYQVGRVEALRQIKEIKNVPEDAVDVFVNALAIATADGTIDEGEAKVLVELANLLGVRPADYGLEL